MISFQQSSYDFWQLKNQEIMIELILHPIKIGHFCKISEVFLIKSFEIALHSEFGTSVSLLPATGQSKVFMVFKTMVNLIQSQSQQSFQVRKYGRHFYYSNCSKTEMIAFGDMIIVSEDELRIHIVKAVVKVVILPRCHLDKTPSFCGENSLRNIHARRNN